MASVTISIDGDENYLWSHDGFVALISKLMEMFLAENYQSDIDEYNKTLHDKLTSWKVPSYVGITMTTLSKRDFNEVVKALEKGRKYLDTLMTEEAQEEFIEDYIGTSVFNDLKYYVDETIRHCYQDPRYEAKTD